MSYLIADTPEGGILVGEMPVIPPESPTEELDAEIELAIAQALERTRPNYHTVDEMRAQGQLYLQEHPEIQALVDAYEAQFGFSPGQPRDDRGRWVYVPGYADDTQGAAGVTVELREETHPLTGQKLWALWRSDGKLEAHGFESEEEARMYVDEFGWEYGRGPQGAIAIDDDTGQLKSPAGVPITVDTLKNSPQFFMNVANPDTLSGYKAHVYCEDVEDVMGVLHRIKLDLSTDYDDGWGAKAATDRFFDFVDPEHPQFGKGVTIYFPHRDTWQDDLDWLVREMEGRSDHLDKPIAGDTYVANGVSWRYELSGDPGRDLAPDEYHDWYKAAYSALSTCFSFNPGQPRDDKGRWVFVPGFSRESQGTSADTATTPKLRASYEERAQMYRDLADPAATQGASAVATATDEQIRADYGDVKPVMAWRMNDVVSATNGMLRGTADPEDYGWSVTTASEISASMDAAMRPLQRDATLYRSVKRDAFGVDRWAGPEAMPGLVGTGFTDKGYGSTTTDYEYAKDWAGRDDGVEVEIRAPAGTNAMVLEPYSDKDSMGTSYDVTELVIGRGTHYRITGYDAERDMLIAEVEL